MTIIYKRYDADTGEEIIIFTREVVTNPEYFRQMSRIGAIVRRIRRLETRLKEHPEEEPKITPEIKKLEVEREEARLRLRTIPKMLAIITVAMVRDYETKRFIRGLRGVTYEVSLLFKYPPESAKRSNPLYVDIKTSSYVPVEEITRRIELGEEVGLPEQEWFEIGTFTEAKNSLEKELAEEGRKYIRFYFGDVVGRLATVAGVEHKAEAVDEVYPDYHWYLVWHHYKGDEQEEDGVDTIR